MTDSPFVAETVFHVRYAETDAMGIVHHASYIVYFEEGRSHYMRQRGSSYADFERSGFFMAVTQVNAKYHKAARYDQRIRIRCWVEQVRSRTLTFAYELADEETGEVFVTGSTQHICINRDGKVVKIPSNWLTWVENK
ncbi:acyl-CoA thioesterase [Phototrophicus methaneseepsis]|uniref:Acyl-CoA thioesterase n=1 Tax=Phototrophicus methaneseepsis TaxID=2710758 RepID=A0A7S8ID39_9CHLR|nr:thioesterase family protein [Phototrophicus methaneseepsis]QPC80954.1 acyl-CoA thioesterase [Phototrophicus methaneseepsis]